MIKLLLAIKKSGVDIDRIYEKEVIQSSSESQKNINFNDNENDYDDDMNHDYSD